MKKKLKHIPKFSSEEEERAFWSIQDSNAYIDWEKAGKAMFPNLKPSTKSISISLPLSLLEEIKISANQKDVPYQSYLKILLHQGVAKERRKHALSWRGSPRVSIKRNS